MLRVIKSGIVGDFGQQVMELAAGVGLLPFGIALAITPILLFDPGGGILPSRPPVTGAAARSGGQGRAQRAPKGFPWRPRARRHAADVGWIVQFGGGNVSPEGMRAWRAVVGPWCRPTSPDSHPQGRDRFRARFRTGRRKLQIGMVREIDK